MAKRTGSIRFEDDNLSRLYECHLFIVSVTDTRNGLIEAWRGAKATLPPFLLAQVITAIRERQATFLDHEQVAATKSE